MMNQFAKLLSAEIQTLVLLDTCTRVNVWNKKLEALKFRSKIAGRKDMKMIVPGILIREVAKVAKITVEKALVLIESFLTSGQIDYINYYYNNSRGSNPGNKNDSKRDDDDNDNNKNNSKIENTANQLKAKYFRYCHYLDNYYLYYCNDNNAVLITYDNDLRQVAKMEEIMSCTPGNFRIYQ